MGKRKSREAGTGMPAVTGVPPTGKRGLSPALIAIAAAACLALGVGAGVLGARMLGGSGPESVGLPSGSGSQARLALLEAEVRANPGDLARLLALAHLHLDEGRGGEAAAVYKQVLDVDSQNVEAITHVGIMLAQAGQIDQALAHLDRALGLDPRYAHALWDKAQILYQAKQDFAGAADTWEAFLRVIPTGTDADNARAFLAEARSRMAAGPPASPVEGGARGVWPGESPAGAATPPPGGPPAGGPRPPAQGS